MKQNVAFPVALIVGLSFGATSCAAIASERQSQRPVLFECSDETHTVRLLGAPEGKVTLVIGDIGHGRFETTVGLGDPSVKIGNVSGQMGGSQSHLRITSDDTHYILLHGVDGQMAEQPGREYAGVSLVEGDFEREVRIADCASSLINSRLLENIDTHARSAGAATAVWEPADGPFDGWF